MAAYNILHLGGFGAVGRRLPRLLPSLLPSHSSISVTCLDCPPIPPDGFDVPHSIEYNYIQLPPRDPNNSVLQERTLVHISSEIEPNSLDLIISTSGHWMPGNLPTPQSSNEEVMAFADSYASLHASCVEPTVAALTLAGKYLKPTGSLVLTGAQAAVSPVTNDTCGGMLTYGFVKSFTNTLAQYAATNCDFTTIVYHPTTIDTEANRNAMPDADHETWNNVDEMVSKVIEKALKNEGGEYTVRTEGGKTDLVKL